MATRKPAAKVVKQRYIILNEYSELQIEGTSLEDVKQQLIDDINNDNLYPGDYEVYVRVMGIEAESNGVTLKEIK